MSAKILKISFILIISAIFTSACSISTTSNSKPSTAGRVESSLFLSVNQGETWVSRANIPTVSGRPKSLADINVNTLVMDPQDSQAIYLASFDKGLFFTYNINEGWQTVGGLPQATVNDVQIDPKNKCLIYAAISNRVYRSNDCARTWEQIYFDNDLSVSINTLAIDHFNPKNLYLGTSRGEIIKSIDAGAYWRTIQRNTDGIARLIISPLDSRLIFVATSKNEIYSFSSNTTTNPDNSEDLEANFVVNNWQSLNDVLKDFNLGTSFKDLIIGAKDGSMFLVTDQLILRSADRGITWEKINLIPPAQDAVIKAVAVDPQNSQNLYYVTNTTFFHSADGGATWSTKKLPTNRAGRKLLVDFSNPKILYLGTIQVK